MKSRNRFSNPLLLALLILAISGFFMPADVGATVSPVGGSCQSSYISDVHSVADYTFVSDNVKGDAFSTQGERLAGGSVSSHQFYTLSDGYRDHATVDYVSKSWLVDSVDRINSISRINPDKSGGSRSSPW